LQRENRRLAAIIAADVAGYSRLIGQDEEATLRALRAHRNEFIDPLTAEHGGRIANTAGDSLLLEFSSAVDAVRYAIAFQEGMAERNADIGDDRRIVFRVGINVGDVVAEGIDLLGDGVNIAARLQEICDAGDITLSDDAYRQVRTRLDAKFEECGAQKLKNIAESVDVWTLRTTRQRAPSPTANEPLPLLEKPSIAVLPFDNMSGDAEQNFLCDGITEDIITALSRLRWFLVIARNSTFVYKGRSVDVTQVGRELGVRYVLEGSIRKSGDRVRIAAQLVDTNSGTHHWAQNFDRELADIFELQDDIAQSVAAAIEPKLVAAEGARSQNRSSQDLSAWEMVTRAMTHYGRMTTDETETAIKLLRSTVEKYPNYGPAHSLLAFAILVSGHVGWTPESDEYSYAADLAQRAVQLDNEDPWSHLALGYLAFTRRLTDEAILEYKRALELNPKVLPIIMPVDTKRPSNGVGRQLGNAPSSRQPGVYYVRASPRPD
jgi:TolB-like protein